MKRVYSRISIQVVVLLMSLFIGIQTRAACTDPLAPYVDWSSCDFSNVDFSGADLRFVDLSYSNLTNANLSNADLSYASLGSATLTGANLSSVSAFYTFLDYAFMPYANLQNAYFHSGYMRNVYLDHANMRGAQFVVANLMGDILSNADLTGANIFTANLTSVQWGSTICVDGSNSNDHFYGSCLMDLDTDHDGIPDTQDCYPLDNTKSCSPGTYPSGGGIAQAPAGSYAINGVLSQCAAGTYQPLTGQSSCNADTTCSANQYQSVAPTLTSNRVCTNYTPVAQCAAYSPTANACTSCNSGYVLYNNACALVTSSLLLRNLSTGDFNLAQLNGLTVLNQGSLSGALTDPDNGVVSTADFNGDGTADILTRGDANGLIPGAFHIDLMSGPNVIDSNWLLTMSTDLNDEVMSTKDFNRDGKADVLLRNKVTGVWTINYMNGTSDPTIASLNATLDTCYTLQGDGDYDGNGYPDLLLRKNHCGGASYPWLMYTTNGTPNILASGTLPGVAVSPNWGAVVTDKDFDGDGKSDLLVRFLIGTTQQWVLYNLNGVGAPSANGLLNIAVQSLWQFAAEGDFNSDGKADLLLRNTNNGQWYIYLLNSTAILSGAPPATITNQLWTLQGTDDYNGDGKSDILIRNTSSGQWYMNFISGTTVQSKGLLTINSDVGYVLQND